MSGRPGVTLAQLHHIRTYCQPSIVLAWQVKNQEGKIQCVVIHKQKYTIVPSKIVLHNNISLPPKL